MAYPRKTDNMTCQNLHCKYRQKEKDKNITKHGKSRAGHQIYKCQHCNICFTQTKNTSFYRKHLTE